MARRKKETIRLITADPKGIDGFVQALNTEFFSFSSPNKGHWVKSTKDYRPVQRELRRLVQAWFDSGPNVSALFGADPILQQAALRGSGQVIATKGRRALLSYTPVPQNMSPGDPLEIALGLFLGFLLNPENDKLGGPCANCGRYYVKKTKRQTVYCSKSCGTKQSSVKANRARRKQEYSDQLERARQSIAEWASKKRKDDWKVWVSKETQIKKNWLTRALKSGRLLEPAQ